MIWDIDEVDLKPDPSRRSAKLSRASSKNGKKAAAWFFKSAQSGPLWKRQLFALKAAQSRNKNQRGNS
jgi:hypothetical protein